MHAVDLSSVFGALADPTRRAIVARLALGEAPVKELAEPFALSGPAITKHLKVLERAGLISRSREGQLRPCRLEARALEPALDWIEQYRAMWEDSLDRLGEYLKSVAPARGANPPVEEAPPKSGPPSRKAATRRALAIPQSPATPRASAPSRTSTNSKKTGKKKAEKRHGHR